MAQYTPNFNLYEPDSSDDFADFRTEFNNNMDIIDQNLGGGGGSGGHTIIDENDTPMTQRTGLQFTGNVSVSDDAVNDKTVVDILGGGGNVYGAFIDPSRIIVNSAYTSNLSYTATEDCYIYTAVALNSNTGGSCAIDGQNIASWWNGSGGTVAEAIGSYLKKGQTFTATATNASSSGYMVYGLTQGTNGIYAPVIYSDNERVIGVWRDNKPLYQKTIYTNNATVNNAVTISVSSLNIDSLVDIEGTYDRIVNWISPPLHIVYCFNGFESNNEQSFIRYDKDDNNILYRITVDSNEATSYQAITIRYTKTTDVAGSGNWNVDGVPMHHYSTSEQVVGTWINNKPLYEKTVELTSLDYDSNWHDKTHGIADIATIVDVKAVCTTTDGYFYPVPTPRANTTLGFTLEFTATKISYLNNWISQPDKLYVTIQYTKTTD